MRLGGDYYVFPFHNPWPRTAKEIGVSEAVVTERVRHLTKRIAGAFADAAATPDVVALGRDLPARLVDRVADRAARCAQLIAPDSA